LYLIVITIRHAENNTQPVISPCQGISPITSAARLYRSFHDLLMCANISIIAALPTPSRSPRCRTHPNHDFELAERFPLHLQKWETEAGDLQDPEPLFSDLPRYRGTLKTSMLSPWPKPRRRKRARTSVLWPVVRVPNDWKWKIKPLGAGFSVQRVSMSECQST